MLCTGKLEGQNHLNQWKLKSPIPNTELRDLECVLLGSGLSLAQQFLTMPPLLPLGMAMHILSHFKELCNFPFVLQGLLESQKRFWIFKLC